ncbi:MAG: helix-turn-helix domain-containing protein, partial [Candidatus Polarisedimenticolia bacterium]
ALCAYAWPGNVRELRNVVERIMILESRDVLHLEDLPPEIRSHAAPRPAAGEDGPLFMLPDRGVVLEQVEESLVRQALERAKGNRSRAARLVGVSRDALRYKIRKFKLADDFPAPNGGD